MNRRTRNRRTAGAAALVLTGALGLGACSSGAAAEKGLEVTGLPGLMLAFVITALAATLMVSRIPYRSFKDRAAGERVRYSRLLLVPVVIALIAIDPPVVLFLLFSGYALSGPLVWSWVKLRRRPRGAPLA